MGSKFDDPDAIPGVIQKTASVSPLEISDEDLKKINRYTLSPVTADEVFVFKASIADNEQDDRNHMPFDLQDMAKLYPGKTVIKDHERTSDNQIARVYDTELVQTDKTTDLGEPHTELIAKIYMIRTDSNKDLIAEICGGIKKEVSTTTIPKKLICSICGTDNLQGYCNHWPGRDYEVLDANGKRVKQVCAMLMSGIKEAYELSLVAVPAQPRAGTRKSLGFAKPFTKPEEKNTEKLDERIAEIRISAAESFFNANREENA